MKLIVENAPEHKRWLTKAFEVICQELGIAKAPWTVQIRISPPSSLPENCGGLTSYDHLRRPRECLVQIRDERTPLKGVPGCYSMVQVFCHEMFHVKQHIKDGLKGDCVNHGTWWHGKFYPGFCEALAMSTRNLSYAPWEAEAYFGMKGLAAKVEPAIKGLVPKEKCFM